MRVVLLSLFLSLLMSPVVLDAQLHLGTDILQGSKAVKLPVEHRNGFIIVKAKFAKYFEFNFILDTGSSNNIIFDKLYTDAIGMAYSDTIEVYGADLSEKKEALVAREIQLKFDKDNAIYRDFIVLKEYGGKINNIIGEEIHGILGGDFIKGLVLTLNYDKKHITLTDPNHFSSDALSIPIKLLNKKPYFISQVSTADSTSRELLLIDTGSKIPVILRSYEIKDTSAAVHYIGHGLNGAIFGKLGYLKSFNMGPYQYTSVVFSSQILSDSLEHSLNLQAGIIGESILKKFELSIDYSRLKMYITPLSKTLKDINLDQSGLVLHLTGNDYKDMEVIYVLPNSLADEAGIQKGDIVSKVGCWPIWLFSYGYIQRRLEQLDERKLKLTFKRGDEKYKVTLKKEKSRF